MNTRSREDALRILDAYFNALMSHDVSNIPLAPDVVFKRPNGEEYRGIEKVSQFLSNLN